MRFAVPKTGLEVNFEAIANQPGGFVFSWTQGINRFAIAGCVLSERDLSVDNASGNVEVSASFVGTELIRLA